MAKFEFVQPLHLEFPLPEDRNRFVCKIVICNRIVSYACNVVLMSFNTASLNSASLVTHELQCFVVTNRPMICCRALNIKTPRHHHRTVTCCDTCDCSRACAVRFSRMAGEAQVTLPRRLRVDQNAPLHGLPMYTP